MSRLGKKEVPFSDKVKVDYKDRRLTVKGPNGEIDCVIQGPVELEISDGQVKTIADFESPEGRMFGGTARATVLNMILGVTEGFSKTLELVGTGYRAQVNGQDLVLSLGYSHPVNYLLPPKVSATVEANTKIVLKSCDKQLLGQVAAEIRKYRPPEPYKGKGVLFAGEKIQKKAGKTAKK